MPLNSPHIFHLSEDIVLFIFSLCGPAAFADKLLTAKGVQNERWIKNRSHAFAIIHTCRLWRTYALRTPLLWSIPFLDRPKLCQMMLERARKMPLTVRWPPRLHNLEYDEHGDTIRGEAPEPEDQVSMLFGETLKNATRVHEIALSAGSEGLSSTLASISGSFAVDTLRIGPTEHASEDEVWRIPEDTIPAFPSLRQLVCHSCLPPISYLGPNTIAVLTLDCSSVGCTTCLHVASFEEILNILRCASALTRLTLVCVVNTQSVPSTRLPPVELRNLQQLHIYDGPEAVAALAFHIRSPHRVETTLSVCLSYDHYVSEWETHCARSETVSFLGAVRDLMRMEHVQHIPFSRAIFSTHHHNFNYRLSLDGQTGLQAEALPVHAFSIQFSHVSNSPTASLEWGSGTLDLKNIVDLILDIQPLWELVHADLVDAEPANADELATALHHMPCLQYLTLCKSPTLVKVLSTAIAQTHGDSVPCPSLSVLRLLYSDVWQDSDSTVFEEVCSGLQGRQSAGRQKLARIVIDERTYVPPLSRTAQSDRTRMLAQYAEHIDVPSAASGSTSLM